MIFKYSHKYFNLYIALFVQENKLIKLMAEFIVTQADNLPFSVIPISQVSPPPSPTSKFLETFHFLWSYSL
jgi:hypothetical protein